MGGHILRVVLFLSKIYPLHALSLTPYACLPWSICSASFVMYLANLLAVIEGLGKVDTIRCYYISKP